MINFIIVIILSSYLYLTIRNQEKALMLLLFLLPTYLIRSTLFGIPFTLLEGFLLILFGVWFFYNYKDLFSRVKARVGNTDNDIRSYPFGFELVLWIVLAFLAVWVANFSNAAFGVWKAYFFEPALFYILIYNIFVTSAKTKEGFLEDLIFPLSSSALALSLFAIIQKFTAWGIENPFWADEATRRVTSVFTYPNALGLYLTPIIMLSLGYFFYKLSILPLPLRDVSSAGSEILPCRGRCPIGQREQRWIKLVLSGVSVIFSCFAIFFAKSEGAMVAVLVAILIFSLIFIVKRFKALKIILVSNIILITIFVFLSPLLYEYLVPKYTYPDFGSSVANKVYDKITLKDFSGEVRKQQWHETMAMMKDRNRWFWGAGLSYYQKSVLSYHQEGIFFNRERDPQFRQKIVLFNEEYKAKYWYPVEIYMYPHNLLLNFWVELGFFGVLLFIWITVNFFILAFTAFTKENKYLVAGVTLAMLTIIIHGIVDVPYFKNDLALMFWLIVGMMGILNLPAQGKSASGGKVNKVENKK